MSWTFQPVLLVAALTAGGGAFTLDAAPGTYVESGSAATIVAERIINAATESYASTGSDATIISGRVLVAAVDSYSTTGVAAIPLGTFLVPALTDSYATTGAAATLVSSAGASIDASPGSYVADGILAAVVATRVRAFSPGTYAASGLTSIQERAFLFTAAEGLYAVSGGLAGIIASRLVDGGSGSFVLSGQAAVLDRGVPFDAGTYITTGNAAGLVAPGRTIAVDSAAYTVAGAGCRGSWDWDTTPVSGGGPAVVIIND